MGHYFVVAKDPNVRDVLVKIRRLFPQVFTRTASLQKILAVSFYFASGPHQRGPPGNSGLSVAGPLNIHFPEGDGAQGLATLPCLLALAPDAGEGESIVLEHVPALFLIHTLL